MLLLLIGLLRKHGVELDEIDLEKLKESFNEESNKFNGFEELDLTLFIKEQQENFNKNDMKFKEISRSN